MQVPQRAVCCLIFAVACLATSGVFIRYSHLGPVATGGWRLILALPMLMTLNQYQPKRKTYKKIRWFGKDFWLLQVAGACLALDITVWNISFFYTTLAEANLLVNLVPFIAIPLAYFLFKEQINRGFILGLAIAIIGIIFLTVSHDTPTLSRYLNPSRHLYGNLLAISAAVFYSFFFLTTKFVRNRYNAIDIMIAISPAAIIVLMGGAWLRGEVYLPHSFYDMALLVGMALFAQIFGQTLIAYSIRYLSVALASILMLLQPIISAVYAYFIFHEHLSWAQISYMLMVLVGIHLARIGLRKL